MARFPPLQSCIAFGSPPHPRPDPSESPRPLSSRCRPPGPARVSCRASLDPQILSPRPCSASPAAGDSPLVLVLCRGSRGPPVPSCPAVDPSHPASCSPGSPVLPLTPILSLAFLLLQEKLDIRLRASLSSSSHPCVVRTLLASCPVLGGRLPPLCPWPFPGWAPPSFHPCVLVICFCFASSSQRVTDFFFLLLFKSFMKDFRDFPTL